MPVLARGLKAAMRIVPYTTTDADDKIAPVTGFDTAIDLTTVSITGLTFPGNDESSAEYFENEIGGDVTIRYQRNKKVYDLDTDAIAASTSGSVPKIKFKAFLTVAQQQAVEALIGRLCAVMIFLEDTTGAVKLEYHLTCVFSGDIEFTEENKMMKIENEFVGKPITVDGGSTVTHAEYNTAVTTATITPTGESAITPTAIASGDFDTIKTGQFAKVTTA